MTEPVDVAIQAALLGHLTTPALSGSPSIAYPFVVFSPIPGTAYLDARPILRAEPDFPSYELGSVVRRGVFQVDAVAPEQKGEAEGLRLAALVIERFPVGLVLTINNLYRLRVERPPWVASAIKDAVWIRYPVSVRYLIVT